MKTKNDCRQTLEERSNSKRPRVDQTPAVIALLLIAAPSALGQDTTAPFTKITTGVIVTDSEGSTGGSWADYDNDGFPDLFVANFISGSTARNSLYHNLSGTNFSRVGGAPWSNDLMGVWSAPWADYDNDGHIELVAANVLGGTLAQRLYRKNANSDFSPVLDAALQSDTAAAGGALWIDYDKDGFLDLFVAKGVFSSSVANDCLFRNNEDGAFRKMTAAEVGPILNDQLRTEFCFSCDYDNDGCQEISVVYNTSPAGGVSTYSNCTWRCQSNGTFAVTTAPGLGATWRWWGDYDNDGWLDAFGCDRDTAPRLFRNLGSAGFTNETGSLHVTSPVPLNCAGWGDYDNDGWLDLFYSRAYWMGGNAINGLFHNNGDGTFTQILSGSPVTNGGNVYGISWVDYDNDGFLDLFVARGAGTPQSNLLYHNDGNSNHWLKIKLEGRASNRSGIGARVRLHATINGRTFWQMREISCENAVVGQNGLLAHFGLGDATNVTVLRIEWPSGIIQEIQNLGANQFLTIVESQGYVGLAPSLAGILVEPAGLQVSIAEPASSSRYTLEVSTDLINWTKLMARVSAGGMAQFVDTHMTNYSRRFYRLQVP